MPEKVKRIQHSVDSRYYNIMKLLVTLHVHFLRVSELSQHACNHAYHRLSTTDKKVGALLFNSIQMDSQLKCSTATSMVSRMIEFCEQIICNSFWINLPTRCTTCFLSIPFSRTILLRELRFPQPSIWLSFYRDGVM